MSNLLTFHNNDEITIVLQKYKIEITQYAGILTDSPRSLNSSERFMLYWTLNNKDDWDKITVLVHISTISIQLGKNLITD